MKDKDNSISGNITTSDSQSYRPSEGKKDVNLPFTPDMHGLITVDKNKLTRGRYELRADWEMNQISYNVEKPFFVEF